MRLVGYYLKKSITVHGNMNVKSETCSFYNSNYCCHNKEEMIPLQCDIYTL